MNMEQLVMKIFNLFVAPLLVIFLPLQTALLTLGLFFVINLSIQMVKSIKIRNVKWYRIDKYIDDELISYALRTITSYSITILAVSLFEVHVIGLQGIELGEQVISLTRAVVILATAQQLGRAMHALEGLTGFSLFNTLLQHAPNWLQGMFSHKSIKNDDLLSNDQEDQDEEKTS